MARPKRIGDVPVEFTTSSERLPSTQVTGVYRSIRCYKHAGFNNFVLEEAHIKDGVVQRVVKSDPFAQFEAIARMEVKILDATTSLNRNYVDGKAWEK